MMQGCKPLLNKTNNVKKNTSCPNLSQRHVMLRAASVRWILRYSYVMFVFIRFNIRFQNVLSIFFEFTGQFKFPFVLVSTFRLYSVNIINFTFEKYIHKLLIPRAND